MGPLAGTKIVEMAGIGPGPFCAMLLADMGADVIRIERPGEVDRGVNFPTRFDLLNRGTRSIALARVAVDAPEELKVDVRGRWLRAHRVPPRFVRRGEILIALQADHEGPVIGR